MFDLSQLRIPLVQAPMAGGPGSVALAVAVSRAGGLGTLAAGYKTPAQLAEQIAGVRAKADAAFGVNVFVPQEVPAPDAVAPYRAELAAEAERWGVTLPEPDRGDTDFWDEKIALLTADPVPVVSFTFGAPPAETVEALRRAGSRVIVTVTTVAEAREAEALGVDALCVQGPEAGGHRGTFDPYAEPDPTPLAELLPAVAAATRLPLIATGGLASGADIAGVLRAGATAAQLGTAYLRTPEAGTAAAYREALTRPEFEATVVTRAFSGRYARGLRNRFIEEHDASAPVGYPLVNQLTKPLRAAAAAAGDAHGLSLWAGVNHRKAERVPAGELTERLWAEAAAALHRAS
ncbi:MULTISPECIES: NAD(P)H-dependent flavin oxidoreductase [Streptomyces]|uniref:Propionate 3-nitronate monooxygenase n=1 Tax=Streptomyces ramulosus TaxID=47762 RepID=A0ABW1FMC4_9ACTN